MLEQNTKKTSPICHATCKGLSPSEINFLSSLLVSIDEVDI